ncbi:hypothetical protein PENTCL1PPCAC_13618, partial [Pristionchus entomophagus]
MNQQWTATAVAIIHGLDKKVLLTGFRAQDHRVRAGNDGQIHAKTWMDGFRLESQKRRIAMTAPSTTKERRFAAKYEEPTKLGAVSECTPSMIILNDIRIVFYVC